MGISSRKTSSRASLDGSSPHRCLGDSICDTRRPWQVRGRNIVLLSALRVCRMALWPLLWTCAGRISHICVFQHGIPGYEWLIDAYGFIKQTNHLTGELQSIFSVCLFSFPSTAETNSTRPGPQDISKLCILQVMLVNLVRSYHNSSWVS